MKHLKTIFAFMLMTVLSIGQVWAGSPATLSFSAKCDGSGTDSDGNSWTISSDGSESSFDNTKGIHYGTSSGQVTYIRLTTSGITGTITQVVVNASTASGVSATAAVKVGTTDFTRNKSTTASLTTTATDYAFTGSASGDILVEITKPSKAAKAIYCKSVVVTYTSGGVVAVESVSLDEDAITLTIDGVEQQTLTATVLPENATNKNVTWESDDEDVATVENGVVTAVGAGDATITCKSVADATKYAECAVHVNPSPYSKSNLIFDAACGGTGTADDDAEWAVTSDGAESVYDATSGIHYGTGSASVTYLQLATSDIVGSVAKVVVNARDAQAKATISVTVGGTAFTCSESTTATNTSTDYTFTGTGSGEIVVRVDRGSSMVKAIYVKSIKVSYIPSASVKKPTFSVEAGSYLEAQSVELNCTTTGADIYYTLNGDDPDENSTHYEGAIPVSTTTTIKAIAILGTTSSPIATATYTIINTSHAGTAEDPYSVADAITVIDGIGTKEDAYVSGIISQVDSYNSTYKSITYWISADGTTTNQLQVYSGKGIEGADFSSVDDVVVKATVVVKGTLKMQSSTYEFNYNNELVSYQAPVEPIVALKQSGSAVTALNVEATSVANQAIDVVCTNFGSAISSVSAKLYGESSCETEITSGAWVTDITVNGAKDQVTFNVADNAGEARQVWMKVTASDGTNTAYAVLAISQAKFIVDYATLPFAYDGNGTGELPNGLTVSGTGTYNTTPAIKFDGTDDNIIIKINADPGTLTYDIKGNSYSNSTFKVQQSANGEDYTDVATYTTLGSDVNSESKTLAQTTRYVKFIYTNKSSGNVALGNIAIAAYVAPTACEAPTFDPADGESFTESLDVVLTSATEGATIYYTLDESDPTTSSSVFNTKITLSETTTIKAIAVKEGLNNSSVASATYTKAVTITSYNIDFETNNLAAYVNWDFNNIAIVSTAIDAHGGTYYGNTGGKESASITTKAKIAAPGPLTFWTSKESGNTTASYWTVEVSEDGSAWTQVGDPFSAITGSKGDWTKCEADLSEHTNVYVRISYGSSTAIRAIDDISLEMAAVKPKITTQPVGATYIQDETPEALSIVAEAGNSGALSYQWYSNSSESTEGAEAIDGADDNEYTPSTTSLGTVYYYCVVTEVGAEETTTSSIVAVVVSAAPEPTGTFELFSGELAEGEYVICSGTNAMKNTATTAPRIEAATITISDNKIVNPDESVIWKVEALDGDDSGYWTFYNEAEKVYAAFTSTNARGNVIASVTNYAKWTTSDNGSSFDFTNKGLTGKYLRFNDGYGFASYATTTGEKLTLYKKQVAGQPKTPTFTVDGGTFTVAQNVEIECATEDVTIYYTLDGSTPTNESKVYSTALEISSTTTVKAIAIKNAIASDVASATYKIVSIDHAGTEADPYTIADARNAIEVGGDLSDKYVSGIISQVDGYNSTYKSITYWISDDGETTSSQLQVYSGKGLNGADFSSINDLQTGDIVVVKGTLKLYESTYEFDKDNQLVSYAKPNVPTVALKKSGSIVTVLNVEAKDVASQTIDIECTYFANAISSVSAILYGESTCETEITSGAWVTDITINDAKDKVTFNVADNEGARRHVWMKVSASDGTNEASATLKISQAKAAYATYPFAFDGGIEDVTNAGGMTQYGLGSDYASSPKLRFDNTGDWLIIKTNEAPSQLTYDIKNNSFSGGTFTVQESADGENYTEVASYTDITGTQKEAVDLDQATRYIKFIYTEKVDGNVGLGNINITKYVAPEPPTPEEIWTEGVREELIEGRYYTMCLDKAVTKVRGASIWKVLSKATDGGIILEEVVGTLAAGRPYFFYATAESMDVVYTGAVVDDPVNDADNNGLVGSFERTEITKNQSNYILHNNALYFVNSEAYVGAYRAYLNMNAVPNYEPAQGNSPRRRVTMSVHAQDVATGVDAISDSEQPMKVMIDNNLYIIRAGQMYDMTGNKVK